MRILVVEDECLLAMNLESMLGDLGHLVVGSAGNRQEALSAADDADLAFVNVRLSDGATGPEIAEELRAAHGVTVVFTTGSPEMVSDDGAEVVNKPYDEEMIASAVDHAAAAHRRKLRAESLAETRGPAAAI